MFDKTDKKLYIFGREEFQKSGTEKLQPQLNNTKWAKGTHTNEAKRDAYLVVNFLLGPENFHKTR